MVARDTITPPVNESDRFCTVVLVSSSAGLRTRLIRELGEYRIGVVAAIGIDEALSLLESVMPEMALISISVNEDEDGLDVARALRAKRSIPIAFLAGGAITPSTGTRLSMVPHMGVLPDDVDASFIHELIRANLSSRSGERGRTVSERAEREQFDSDTFLGEWRAQLIERILHLSPNAVVVLDEQHLVVDWNPAATRLFGYTRREVVGRQLDDLIVDKNDEERKKEARAYTELALNEEPVEPTETVRYRKDGTTVDVILAGEPIHVGGHFRGVVAYYQDVGPVVTARRRVEELLHEKEILLGEIQHRVKNDIALIESMLSLQASRYESIAMKEAITDAINRIASVRGVYDALHRLRGIDRVGARALVDNLLSNHREVLAERAIILETAVDDLSIPTGVAISTGLVVNELLTNTVKYAFPPERAFDERRVTVGLSDLGNGAMTVRVCDTGVGMVGSFTTAGEPIESISTEKLSTTGYGLTFVQAIAEQYRGEVRISGDRGTCVEVYIALPMASGGRRQG